MRPSGRLLVVCLLAMPGFAASIRQSVVSGSASEQTCAPGKPADSFPAGQRQVFFWFLARDLRTTDQVRIEWLEPGGAILQSTPYGEMPAAPEVCFLTQLPVAGFDAATHAGTWTVRVMVNERSLHEHQFRLEPDPQAGKLHVRSVTRREDKDAWELTLDGGGFDNDTRVYVAQYTEAGGWRYLAALSPFSVSPARALARSPKMPPGEYMVFTRNFDGTTSQPARMLVASDTGYKLPLAAGEAWILTQGPNGAFSHWNRTSQAFDIAPLASRCVVAMRGGIAHTFDLGMGQTQHLRSFGNYITIEHDNGEFSHYAHLQAGSFQVANGQHVERGQSIALAGNSGYTFGPGGGHHLHVQVTRTFSIVSQSIPFSFEDLKDPRQRTVVSSNSSPLCACDKSGLRPATGKAPVQAGASASLTSALNKVQKPVPPSMPKGPRWSGTVAVEGWWTQVFEVAAGVRSVEMNVAWEGPQRRLDLYVTSPAGRQFGGTATRSVKIADPEVGWWRVSVRGMAGSGEIPFEVEGSLLKPASVQRASGARGGVAP